jgi:bacterioferritin
VKGNAAIVRKLNEGLTNELTAIDQYFVHPRMFDHWGFTRLGKRARDASIDETKQADSRSSESCSLEELPNLQDQHKLLAGENVEEALACDLRLEPQAHPLLKGAVTESEACGDCVSRDLFRRILASEEEHIDRLETQLALHIARGRRAASRGLARATSRRARTSAPARQSPPAPAPSP